MALFQPTNIIPSSLIGQGTVDVEKPMEISWQVNGNSAMTAFQIDFYMNDTASTYVTSTNKIADGIPTNGFYGTDRFGNPQFFTYNPNGQSWEEWSKFQLSNGNEYKFKIIQWFNATNNVVSCQPSSAQTSGTQYYFTVNNGTYQGAVVSFTAPSNIAAGATFYYSFTNGECWVESGNRTIVLNGNMNANGDIPSDATELLGNQQTQTLNYMFVAQNSASIFVTRATPTLTINQTNENYLNPILLPATLTTSVGYFQAAYPQDRNDAIRWVRWQVAQATYNTQTKQWVLGEILADTGDIYTPTLNFEFNGFFNGQQYAIRCFGESESGQETQLTNTNQNGWVFFNITLNNQAEYTGNFMAQCLNKENAVLLKWEGVEVIPPETSPERYEPTILDGSVTLNGQLGDTEYSVTWNKQGTNPMNFAAPWAAAWKGKIQDTLSQVSGFTQEQTLPKPISGYLIRYSPDGKFFVVYNYISSPQMIIYSVTATGVELKGYLRSGGTITTGPTQYYEGVVTDIAFSPNGNLFAVSAANMLFLYNFNDGNFTLLDSTRRAGFSIAFSPDSKLLVRSSTSLQVAYVYSVVNNTLTELYSLTIKGVDIYNLQAIDFSGDGKWMCLCGIGNGSSFKGAYLFSVNGEQISFYQKLPIDEYCWNLAFNKNSSNPTMLIVGGASQYYHFSIKDGNVSLQANLTDVGNIYQAISRSISFSPDGDNLLIGGSGYINWYRINGSNVVFNSKITLNDGVSWGNAIAIDWNPQNNQIAIEDNGAFEDNSNDTIFIFAPQYSNPAYAPQGRLFALGLGETDEITISRQDDPITVQLNDTTLASISVPKNTTETALVITPTTVIAYFYGNEELLSSAQQAVTYTQQAITSVSIYGGTTGATIDGVSIYQGDGSNILSLYQTNPDFEPVWNDENYSLYMTANFNINLEGGTGTATGKGFQIYRQEAGKTTLTPIANVNSTVTSLKDYGIVSQKAYKYSLYAYDNTGAFMNAVEAENTIATSFKNYSLLVCDYDQEKDAYHVRKQYLFALNLSDGSVGNNNSPTLNANFTAYPTRMPSTQNYASGTLSGLIGAIYTVPALIEQIGQYKYTAKPSTMDYFDSVDLEQELYGLSVAPYQLFLRDMKGRLRMIATSGPITMTTNLKQKQQSITISLPWVEVGDASDVTIIQTPDDYGWGNDNQVLDVQLDVDVVTGELSAQYPFPYNGTKFYLTGVNKEILTAKTPIGVTPAQFELSDTAEQPDDGELTATVTVNSEDK